MYQDTQESAQPSSRRIRMIVTTLRHIILAAALSLACFAAGWVAVVLVMGAGWSLPNAIAIGLATVLLVWGSLLCGYAAFRVSAIWFIYPLLFGGPMFLFGGTEFSPPDPVATLIWRSIGISFVLLPSILSFLVWVRKRNL
jgi:hypothetical protein